MSGEKNIEIPQDRNTERTEEINISPADTGMFIVGKELETLNPKTGTANMEVHHHPQVEKKNFKEYFLEFIMIFLVVTIGLYYRE